MTRINLILQEGHPNPPDWEWGPIFETPFTPQSLADLPHSQPAVFDAEWVFMLSEDGIAPSAKELETWIRRPAEVVFNPIHYHGAGLEVFRAIFPNDMLRALPDPAYGAPFTITNTLTPHTLLFRADLVKKITWISPHFHQIGPAVSALGRQWTGKGVRIHQVADQNETGTLRQVDLHDQLLLARTTKGLIWSTYIAFQRLSPHTEPLVSRLSLLRRIRRLPLNKTGPYLQPADLQLKPLPAGEHRVSVLIPTLNRYDWLEKVLLCLEQQTVKPYEVLIIDQSDVGNRRQQVGSGLDLNIRHYVRDKKGQSSARNYGLQRARGDYICFLDDDVEMEPDLIENHLRLLHHYQVDISSGLISEPDCVPPENYKQFATSPVFPTCNALIRAEYLAKAQLFDLAFDFGKRADYDFGMRLRLAGASSMLNPAAHLFHHRAPEGGLRAHGQRKTTFSGSRERVNTFHLASAFDCYLALRYFGPDEMEALLRLSLISTFRVHGNPIKKGLKILFAGAKYFSHKKKLAANAERARSFLETYPQIPKYQPKLDAP